MKIIINTLIALFFLSVSIYAQKARYKWQYNTTTHLLIQKEEHAGLIDKDQADKKFQLIDSVIFKCGRAIKKMDRNSNSEKSAIEILRTIDSTLAVNRFTICVEVPTYSTGLTLKPISSLNCTYYRFPLYRELALEKFDSVFHLDCDLSSFLYFGIGQALNLPIGVFEVPKHNSIRWTFPNRQSFNWDVNLVHKTTDSSYRSGTSENRSFSNEQEVHNKYLQNWDEKEIFGYYYMIIGRELKTQKKYEKAKVAYYESIKLRPYSPKAKYCLAYMIIFTGYFNSVEDFTEANRLQKQAFDFDPSNIDYAEALACSYALINDFDNARKIADENLTNRFDEDLKDALFENKNGIEIYRSKHKVFD